MIEIHKDAVDIKRNMAGMLYAQTSNLIESHMEELESNHCGDADHDGEAPEICSYCFDIQEAREILRAAGLDVEALTPLQGGSK